MISPPIGTVDHFLVSSLDFGKEGREARLTKNVLQSPFFDSRILVDDFCSNDCCLLRCELLPLNWISSAEGRPHQEMPRSFQVFCYQGNLPQSGRC